MTIKHIEITAEPRHDKARAALIAIKDAVEDQRDRQRIEDELIRALVRSGVLELHEGPAK